MNLARIARRLRSSPALLFALCAPAVAGQVHVVDPGGAGDFTTLQAAVDAAAEGDTILVNGGQYSTPATGANAVLAGKSLSIARGTGGEPYLRGTLEITGLAGSQEVHVQGLRVREVLVTDCDGDVLLEDLNAGVTSTFFQHSMAVVSSGNVVTAGSRFIGYNGWDSCGGQCNQGADGGPAVQVLDSRLSLYHCDLDGGIGEDGAWLPCGIGGDGGDGLLVSDAGSRVRHLATTFTGGLEGWGGCGNGWIGAPVNAPAGTVAELTTPVTRLEGPATAIAGTGVNLEITGPPGAVVFLLTTTDLRSRFLPLSAGTLHMKSFSIDVLPPVPPSGTLVHGLSIPPLPPGAEARWRLMQAVFNQSGSRFLGPPRGLIAVR
jgi:hypothetical protein